MESFCCNFFSSMNFPVVLQHFPIDPLHEVSTPVIVVGDSMVRFLKGKFENIRVSSIGGRNNC